MTFAELLDSYEAGRVSRNAAIRWIGCRRYAEFLIVLDYRLQFSGVAARPVAVATAATADRAEPACPPQPGVFVIKNYAT
jgi:hypothetical protein